MQLRTCKAVTRTLFLIPPLSPASHTYTFVRPTTTPSSHTFFPPLPIYFFPLSLPVIPYSLLLTTTPYCYPLLVVIHYLPYTHVLLQTYLVSSTTSCVNSGYYNYVYYIPLVLRQGYIRYIGYIRAFLPFLPPLLLTIIVTSRIR